MSTKDAVEKRRNAGSVLYTRAGGRVHQSAVGYDIELLQKWLGMAIKEGTDRIKIVVHPTEANKWVVTIVDKKEQ